MKKNTIDKVIDKMIELTQKTSWRKFKARTVKTNEEVEIHKFYEHSAIKNYIKSKDIEVLYNSKIYNVNDFLELKN